MNRPPSVVHMLDFGDPGGAQTAARALSDAMAASQLCVSQVMVLGASDGTGPDEALGLDLAWPKLAQHRHRIRALLTRTGPSVVITHQPRATALLASLGSVPWRHVFVRHWRPYFGGDARYLAEAGWLAAVAIWSARRASVIVEIGGRTARLSRRKWKIPNLVVPHHAGSRHDGGILTVGNWRPEKGYSHIPAIRRVLGSDLLWRVVGPSPERVPALGPNMGGVAPTTHEKVLELIAGCQVLAHVSRFETFGLSAAEALVMGVPVVAWDLPFNRELKERWPRLRLVPAYRADRMACAIAQAAEARERTFCSPFNQQDVLDGWRSLLEEVW